MATGKVIKGNAAAERAEDASAPPSRPARSATVINAETYQAHQSAQSIVEAARKEAGEIIQNAHREKERIIAEAREEGRQEGLAIASNQIIRANIVHAEIIERAQRDVIVLALKVAERILGRDLERDPAIVAEICAAALDNARTSHQVVVRVHPKDAALLRDLRDRVMDRAGRVGEIRFKEDSEVAPGGCIIETDGGVIDAQLATQLGVLQEILLGEVESKKGAA